MKKELTNQELEDLIEAASVDANITKTWNNSTAVAVKSYMRKRGVLQKSDTWAAFSFINWSEHLMTRFYLLAVNAYIGRAIKEEELDGKMSLQELEAVKKFFGERLCFNAYKHVSEGLDVDISKEDLRKELGFGADDRSTVSDLTKDQRSTLTMTRDSIRSARNTLELSLEQIPKKGPQADVLKRRIKELNEQAAKINNLLGSSDRVTLDALENVPPMDNVHGFNKFCADNWSNLRHITKRVYNVPGDMEVTLWFHGAANSLEKIMKFQEKINKECTFGAEIIGNGAPTLIAPDLIPEQANEKFNSSDYSRDIISKYIDRAEEDNKIVHKIIDKKVRTGRKKIVIDDFKKNPEKLKKALAIKRAGKKQETVSGVNEYNRLVTSFRPGNNDILSEEQEREIIDEVLESNELDDLKRSLPEDECVPIRILGQTASGEFGEIEQRFAIPDEMSVEHLADRHLEELRKQKE